MPIQLVDVTFRALVERNVDPEDLAGNICSRIEEQLLSGETLIDIDVENVVLPLLSDGSCDSGVSTCPEEAE
jgi:hypothetical protein